MATSAFKSTTKRTPIGKSQSTSSSAAGERNSPSSASSSSTSVHRRSRSLSRFSRPYRPSQPDDDDFSDDSAAPPPPSLRRARFVNTVRGSSDALPEITLDDLAISFFGSADRSSRRSEGGGRTASPSKRRGRSVSRHSIGGSGSVGGGGGYSGRIGNLEASSRRMERDGRNVAASQRRGRSASRHSVGVGGGYNAKSVNSDANSWRRRSVSVVRSQISDSESDHSSSSANHGHSNNVNQGRSQVTLSNTTAIPGLRQGIRRTLSQKDLKCNDGYSSHSSALTDDDNRDAHGNNNGTERTIRTVYSQKKADHPLGEDMNRGLYEAMRKELRHAVEEIKMELAIGEQNTSLQGNAESLQSKNSDVLQAVSTIRRNYTTKLEQSEKRKQDLLAEIVMEEQHGRELSKIVKELLPEPNNNVIEKPSRDRKRSKDRRRMSKRLTEEAERYIEDFISNVEDTDISSLDGERSDTSSSLGRTKMAELFQCSPVTKFIPAEMDGVVLPWLQWETSNDASALNSAKPTMKILDPPQPLSPPVPYSYKQEVSPIQEMGSLSISSRGSWNPGVVDGYSTNSVDTMNTFGEVESNQCQMSSDRSRSRIDVDEYLFGRNDEDLLTERWRQRESIHFGHLLLCHRSRF